MSAGGAAGTGAAGTGAAGTLGMQDAGMADAGSVAGTCCADGDCICRGPEPVGLTDDDGPHDVDFYYLEGVGCVRYPTDAQPPFAALALAEGFASAGCGYSVTPTWGPFYASWGIVTITVDLATADQPEARGRALQDGIAALKSENEIAGGRLSGLLAGRYGILGFSMGGGGASHAAQADASLRSNVALMPWTPVASGIEVPTLVICGSNDSIAACEGHGSRLYEGIAQSVPKMLVTISSGHSGLPQAGGGDAARYGLAFQKLFLEGDERWRPWLVAAGSDATNIE
jgi:hypothetical protein